MSLIGPAEPQDRQTHNAPFASHHDAGRITRSVARDVMWARASARSITRYEALAQDSGIDFFTPAGA